MSDDQEQHPGRISPFDAIKHSIEEGGEYWSARDLAKLLRYSTWQKFQHVITQAQKACEQSGQEVADHFNRQVNMITAGKGAQRSKEDYHLSRYACYLIVQNAVLYAKPFKRRVVPCRKTYLPLPRVSRSLSGKSGSA
jgi:hypothetical protein